MRLIFTIVFSTLFGISFLCAQTKYPSSYERNDRFAFDDSDFLYYQEDYSSALLGFQKLYTIDPSFPTINQRIGACLLHLRRPVSEAMPYLEKAVNSGNKEALFDYGVALHRSLKLDEAMKNLELYGAEEKRDKSDEELARRRGMILESMRQLQHPVDVIIKNLGPEINTAASEYVPIITADDKTLFFTARRDDSTAKLKDPEGRYFEDVYFSTKVKDKWGKAVNIGRPINTETHDAVVGTTVDGKSIIIYRTNAQLTGGDLYIVDKKGSTWLEPVRLGKEINTEFQEASACFSPDGKTLFFSSNRPGGLGGKDLYRVKRLPNGQWSLPKNLGGTINTPFDEDSPFMTEDEVLYFASSGHSTMGGYDLFKSQINSQSVWETPVNLGYPINTTGDDIFLSINSGGKKGYFSSDRIGGFGLQDIYEVNFIYRAERQIVIRGKVVDQSGKGMQANLTVMDSNSHTLQGEYKSNVNTGEFIVVVNPLTRYSIKVEAEGYSSLLDEVEFQDNPEKLSVEAINPYVIIKE